MPFAPFCVADRQISLRIIRGIDLSNYSGQVGIMIHANTSAAFQARVKEYPLENGMCPWHRKRHHNSPCDRVVELRKRTVRMCDSGAFTKDGVSHSYEALFKIYDRSGVEFGIIKDVLRNKDATLRSAREAMSSYLRGSHKFHLVGVAQGRNVAEYLACYAALKAIGYKHIAIGGLLTRRKNTARYVYVQGGRLFRILAALRAEYPRDWMFALGCYHPRRHADLARFNLFGSDYKGWIFNYRKDPSKETRRGNKEAQRSRIKQVRRFMSSHVFNDKRSTMPFRGHKPRRKVLAVVACSKKKIWSQGHRGPAIAKESYTGTFFQLATQLADQQQLPWVVLSARHGFLSPGSRIKAPYDEMLPQRIAYHVTEKLRQQVIQKGLHNYRRIVVFGGGNYQSAVAQAFEPFGMEVVSAFPPGTRIGNRLKWLKSGRPLVSIAARAS